MVSRVGGNEIDRLCLCFCHRLLLTDGQAFKTISSYHVAIYVGGLSSIDAEYVGYSQMSKHLKLHVYVVVLFHF